MKVANREQLLSFITQNKSKEISELAIHTFFMSYGYDHCRDTEYEEKLENKYGEK